MQAELGINTNPHTFKEMFAPKVDDTLLLRALKWYVKPKGNPKTTIRILKALQIDQFQRLPRALANHHTKGEKHRYQTNYTIKDSSLSSLVDYGVNKTFFNEAIHIASTAAVLPAGVGFILTDNTLGVALQGGVALINLACILAQRYSRARCEILIDRKLAQGKTIDDCRYENRLDLRLPYSLR